VYFKQISLLPNKHIVNRYFSAIEAIGVKDDGKGLDYFIDDTQKINLSEKFNESFNGKFVAIVVGGSYFTKKIPVSKLIQICEKVKLPIIITGGKEDAFIGEELKGRFPEIINACGQFTINQSASIIKQAEWVITSDTGLMHIAAAFNKKIISLWGNTIPEFGMGPYLPNKDNKILEVKNLGCRPCSKLGFKKCPKGHFKCMNNIDVSELIDLS
jgi:ADP-heptose:LPS heptosyltransferase